MPISIPGLKRSISSPVFAILLFLLIDANFYVHGNRYDRLINFDAKGYYAYLPATFIYDDLNFGFFEQIEKQYYNDQFAYDYRRGQDGRRVNKYFAGTALLQLPFFLVGNAVTSVSSYPQDGFSKLYGLSVLAAAIFYCLIGIVFIDKTLGEHFNVKSAARWVTAVTLVFGTNLHYYTIVEPGYSHVYSFAAISAWIFCVCRFIKQPGCTKWIWTTLLFGLIVFIRPVNAIILLSLPFLGGSFAALKPAWRWLMQHQVFAAVGLMLCCVVPSLQLVVYNIQCGHWWVYAYGEEGFNFLTPAWIEFLFSYRKGAFVYTPLLLIIIVLAFRMFWKNDSFRLISFCVFFAVVVYVLSSWHMWFYGGSFSSRPLVDFLPFFAVLFGLSMRQLGPHQFNAMIATAFVLVAFCQLQMWQYRDGMILWDGMTQERYWDVFLKIPRSSD